VRAWESAKRCGALPLWRIRSIASTASSSLTNIRIISAVWPRCWPPGAPPYISPLKLMPKRCVFFPSATRGDSSASSSSRPATAFALAISNESVSAFLADPEGFDARPRYLVLAHLSENNNNPDVARICAEEALGRRPSEFAFRGELQIASQHEPLVPIQL